MEVTSLVLIGALAVGGYTLVQAQPPPRLPGPTTATPPWVENASLRTACLQEVYRLCSGKDGHASAARALPRSSAAGGR
jgi:hypothetical protein